MAVSLSALMEILTDWPDDLPTEWRDACGEMEPGLGNADPQLDPEFSEPVFPVHPGRNFPGLPVGAHILQSFEGIRPHQVRGVILGQASYPSPPIRSGTIRSRPITASHCASTRCAWKAGARSHCARPIRRRRRETGRTLPNSIGAP